MMHLLKSKRRQSIYEDISATFFVFNIYNYGGKSHHLYKYCDTSE